jgi:tetratricopeptide (TPR) repeat protein
MTRKKENDTVLSSEDNAQVQHILDQFHQIAASLYQATNQQQAEAALSSISDLPETAQLALLKELSRQRDSDAAAILLALNELSHDKTIRKEARRSLIRLEEAKIYPEWKPPTAQTPIIQFTTNAPRFWRGIVTQSREEGEVQLVLCWEQGLDYNEVRMFTFIIDFWERGIKEFIEETGTKRNIENRLQQMRAQLQDITLVDCTLAEGRRLLNDARSVNQWRGTPIHKEYRHHLPTLNQLIWNVEDVGEDRGLTFISPDLEPDEVAGTFVGGWSLGDYSLVYDLLSHSSSLREGMERDEWVAQRRAWADEAHPTRLDLGFVYEREPKAPALWLPNTFGNRNLNSCKEIEVAWSLEISETQLSGTLREMPMGTAVYKETGRHWFWMSYTLVQEDGYWRIQSMTDEGAGAQGLSITELQQRIKGHDDRLNELLQKGAATTREDVKKQAEELVRRMIEAMHLDDALIVKLPLDRTIVGDAYNRAAGIGALERAIAYLERIARNFAEERAAVLRQLGLTQHSLSEYYAERGMTERQQLFASLAVASVRESLTIEDTIAGYGMLAEILMGQGDDGLTEAEALINKAKPMASTPTEEAVFEYDLGNIALQREQFEVALRHYEQVANIDPNFQGIWFRIGYIQRNLRQFEDAKLSYERAIEVEPQNMMPYSELCAIYMNQKQYTKAREILEQGLRAIPKSVHLLSLLASVYLESGDLRHAQAVLAEAEQVDPNYELVQAVRDELHRRLQGKR